MKIDKEKKNTENCAGKDIKTQKARITMMAFVSSLFFYIFR